MIKLVRRGKPGILETNQGVWQQALDLAIKKYGGYGSIPQKERESLVSHYRHEKIKEGLVESSGEKCAFCESKPGESGNIEVEHFLPKSIYPSLTFEWGNFLPSCRKCNGSKSDHDTGADPIVNPYDIDPDSVFYYRDIQIKAIGDNVLGETTIRVCGLNSVRLMRPRAEILVALHDFSESIREAIEDYRSCTTELQRTNRARKIYESIERIELISSRDERYSGFCKSYLQACEPYCEAKKLIAERNG
ncbi:HNH endonuclease [Pseudomonas sp. PB101]|uniref:HNH endonuclease n=1 Tax=Pseudomonas sp. PB101 TaxID=2495428 RepID=UPI0013657ACC|nr:HNH endonuclease [Pseudomonas sp. PB101]MVW87847.1 HNH endonuclease [Pseudomonas sp. PB101]